LSEKQCSIFLIPACSPVIPAQAGIQHAAQALTRCKRLRCTCAACLLQNKIIKVFPLRIIFFYQIQFPGPVPFLDLLLSNNGAFSSIVLFKEDKLFDIVFFTKTVNLIVFMLPDTLGQIGCYSGI